MDRPIGISFQKAPRVSVCEASGVRIFEAGVGFTWESMTHKGRFARLAGTDQSNNRIAARKFLKLNLYVSCKHNLNTI